MGAKTSPIDTLLSKLTGPRHAALVTLRKTIRSAVPEAEECISYGMPAFRLRGKVIAGFMSRADGCSYLPFSGTTLATLAKDVARYERTKSSLHFAADAPLPATLVRKLLAARIAELPEVPASPRPAGSRGRGAKVAPVRRRGSRRPTPEPSRRR